MSLITIKKFRDFYFYLTSLNSSIVSISVDGGGDCRYSTFCVIGTCSTTHYEGHTLDRD